jgi:AraC-like DNA-binding protein
MRRTVATDHREPADVCAQRQGQCPDSLPVGVSVVFDTEAVAPRERAEMWAEQASKVFFPMTIRPSSDGPFRARLAAGELGPVAISRVTGDPNVCARTLRDIAAGDPELLRVVVLRRGLTQVEQAGRSCTIGDGDVVVYDSSRPFVVRARRPFDLVVCGLPAAAMGGHADRLRKLAAVRIPGASATARLYTSFATAVAEEVATGGVGAAESDVADTLVALSRALGRAEEPSGGAAKLRRIQAYIDRHVADPGLTPAAIAAANFVSVRYVHRLFEEEGVSVSRWVRARRLEGCRRDLADPDLADHTIAAIAARWGWSDPARFSRRFREAYGCSPGELRR